MEIRQSREGDEEAIRELFRVVFGKELSEEEWRWKYRYAPWGAASTVAVVEGKIISHYGGMFFRFCQGKQRYMAYELCDVMTHPEYRALSIARKGPFVQAALHFGDIFPMDFVFGFPSVRHARLTKMMLRGAGHRFVSMFVKQVDRPSARRKRLLTSGYGWDGIREDEIDNLWESLKDDYPLTIKKTGKYIFWRYRDCPTRTYELLTLRSALTKRLKAHAVFTVREKELQVLDFFSDKKSGLDALFTEIERTAEMKKAERIRLWVNPSEKIKEYLTSAGYVEEQGFPLVCRIMKTELPLTTDFVYDSYCYRMGDYDAS